VSFSLYLYILSFGSAVQPVMGVWKGSLHIYLIFHFVWCFLFFYGWCGIFYSRQPGKWQLWFLSVISPYVAGGSGE